MSPPQGGFPTTPPPASFPASHVSAALSSCSPCVVGLLFPLDHRSCLLGYKPIKAGDLLFDVPTAWCLTGVASHVIGLAEKFVHVFSVRCYAKTLTNFLANPSIWPGEFFSPFYCLLEPHSNPGRWPGQTVVHFSDEKTGSKSTHGQLWGGPRTSLRVSDAQLVLFLHTSLGCHTRDLQFLLCSFCIWWTPCGGLLCTWQELSRSLAGSTKHLRAPPSVGCGRENNSINIRAT